MSRKRDIDWPRLALARVIEQGVLFETGVPVTFRFVRNTEKSPNFGSTYGQDLEPAGRYLLHNEDPGDLARGWETGLASFENPLVLLLTLDEHTYGPHGWKARLNEVFKAKGKRLSNKLLALGFDGIVTVSEYGDHRGQVHHDTREIVDLAPLKKKNPKEGLRTRLILLRPLLAMVAQRIVDEWTQDEDGHDEEFGWGGACDAIARAMSDVLGEHGIDSIDGGQDGDDHAYLIAYDINEKKACVVDIPPGVYEVGNGYVWKKIPGAKIGLDDVVIEKVRYEDVAAAIAAASEED